MADMFDIYDVSNSFIAVANDESSFSKHQNFIKHGAEQFYYRILKIDVFMKDGSSQLSQINDAKTTSYYVIMTPKLLKLSEFMCALSRGGSIINFTITGSEL